MSFLLPIKCVRFPFYLFIYFGIDSAISSYILQLPEIKDKNGNLQKFDE